MIARTTNKTTILLVLMLIVTVLNKYVIEDVNTKWQLQMAAFSIYFIIYSLSDYLRTKHKYTLIILFIFIGEFIAVIAGFNLHTQYFTELLIALMVFGLYEIIKQWVKR